MAASACLLCLKKVHKKIHFKKYHFVEQGLCKLKAKEVEVAKMGFIPTAVETIDTPKIVSLVSKVHQLPLTNPFTFNFSFS